MRHVKLIAREGMALTNGKESGKVIYLGAEDSRENWEEIPAEEEEWND